jgi:DNA-binding NarL/FixJ family response regulator
MSDDGRSGTRTRVLIVDDHPMFRAGLLLALGEAPDVEVVGYAVDGEQALSRAEELAPDVVLMDISMPGMNGLDATRALTAQDAAPAVLVLTMFEDDDSVFAAMRAGARGYLVKGANQDRIIGAVRSVAAGDAVFGSGIADRVLGYFAETARAAVRRPGRFPQLTAREVEILEHVAAGHSNPQIARTLFLSEKTVRNHVSAIFTKLRVADRSQAIVKAREAGLGAHGASDRV